MACSAARRAAKGVLLREPLKPAEPAEPQAIVLPSVSVTVTIVLLKDAKICTCPEDRLRLPFLAPPAARRAERTLCAIPDLLLSYFLPPRRRPRPATVFLVPLRVREFVRGSLPANRKIAAMTQAPIRTNLDQALDVHLLFAAQVALHLVVLGDELADGGHFGLGEVLDARVGTHPCGRQDLGGARGSDAERDTSGRLRRACCEAGQHLQFWPWLTLSLPLLVLRVLADDIDAALAPNKPALGAAFSN